VALASALCRAIIAAARRAPFIAAWDGVIDANFGMFSRQRARRRAQRRRIAGMVAAAIASCASRII